MTTKGMSRYQGQHQALVSSGRFRQMSHNLARPAISAAVALSVNCDQQTPTHSADPAIRPCCTEYGALAEESKREHPRLPQSVGMQEGAVADDTGTDHLMACKVWLGFTCSRYWGRSASWVHLGPVASKSPSQPHAHAQSVAKSPSAHDAGPTSNTHWPVPWPAPCASPPACLYLTSRPPLCTPPACGSHFFFFFWLPFRHRSFQSIGALSRRL